jgi:lipopolysaccharide biosynthesis glycosyltransferase
VASSGVVLVAAADEAFSGPAALALISAARSTSLPVVCVLLADEISESTSRRVHAAFARAGIAVDILGLPNNILESLPTGGRISRATYGRLLLSRVAGDAERVLWLDADTLTVASIDQLLSMDLEGAPVGAVQDRGIPFVSSPFGVRAWRRRGIPPGVGYFNAGVMLIDVEQWSAQRVEERAIELLRGSPADWSVDQWALNAVLAGRWLPLEERWNARALARTALGRGRWLVYRDGVQRRPAAILHYAGYLKPWDPRHPPSPDRRTYLRAWKRWLPNFPLTVSSLNLSWYARRARRVIRSADGSS